ncbi:four and a half LIM domains protein limpet isoform X2 [Haematobia irritans]|uniref:four and a half LIM domains protein limpet isoform X2 n=1 Tax=Haematobia irritans TaxID=7368 RepID=UPI003F4FA48F
MGDLLSEFGDLVFTLVIGYIGAVEFLYVVRHLYHWSCNHDGPDSGEEHDTDSLARLQENMRQQLANATATEQAAGKKVMRDGVMYEDGFRVDPNQGDIDKLKDQLANKSAKDVKRQELEKELDNQKQIADKIRKELQEKEAEVAERQRKEIEENERRIREAELKREREQREREEAAAKKQREEEERRRQAEAEENARKLKEAQVESERKQREAEEQAEREENERRMLEAERQMEEQQRLAEEMEREGEEQAEREENERRMLEAERQMEEQQHLDEEMEEENERKMLEIEQKLEEHMRLSEASDELTDNERQLIASIKERGGFAEQRDEASDQKEAELLQRILAAREQLGEESEEEQSQKLFDFERDKEKKQRRIEENARLFLEAEREMADLQEQMMEAVQKREFESGLESVPQTPVVEELCVKKMIHPLEDETLSGPVSHRVKTQMAQNRDDSYSRSSKSLLFPGISDDASSNEPISSQQSSFSNQPSDEITTGNESQYPQVERQEPEGEDTNVSQNYSDDYLRSLDGIKGRPLSREDRSGRRIAFKKRRSSGSSNSSRDSRASRDEELKMFTSLEEEEMQAAGQSEFTPLRYSSEPTLKVKGHHRRHKRSPAKDMRSGDESPLERLGEENVDPWGEVVREPYKHTEFWKREKAMSIEEERELEKPLSSEETAYDTATNLPSASSFEEATQIQNEKALSNLRKKDNRDDGADDTKNQATKEEETSRSDTNENLIFSGEYTRAMDKDWHSGHFCCWQCDESLTGQRYVIRDDHPYCIKCYENVFANTCEECNKIIGIDSKDLSYKDKHWHEACFLCFKCHLSLVDKQFGAKADKIYCGNCYDAQFASRCDGCGEVFRAGTKKMEYKTRQWHENCFCCCVCKTAIGTKSFIPREQEIYCAGCYEEKFATRCIKCSKVITSGGVTYKNEPWHRECFTCTHCNITLAGQRFTSRDEKPYCAECFGELFAKRCTSCVKPITGIGGTRFISFEDRHWHHDCFVCASCKTSLVGRGFITDGPDIICPECAKQKLM